MCSINEFNFAHRVRYFFDSKSIVVASHSLSKLAFCRKLVLEKWLNTKFPRIGGISVHVEICVFHQLNVKKDRLERQVD